MSYLKSFSGILAGLIRNYDTYNQNSAAYNKIIPFQFLGGIMEAMVSTDSYIEKKAKELVIHLNIQDAFNNHGLPGDQFSTIKQLHAAIEENPVQFQNAFDLHQRDKSDKIFELTQNIAHGKWVTDEVVYRANVLLNAKWKEGSEIPLDEKPKWVWLTDGLFIKLEKEAWYNQKEQKWEINHQWEEPYFQIHHWMDAPTK